MNSAERLARIGELDQGGTNDWSGVRHLYRAKSPAVRTVLDVVNRTPCTIAVHILRIAAAATLISPVRGRSRGYLNIFLAASGLLLNPRHSFGADGSDQASAVVHGSLAAVRLARSTPVQDAALWNIALQATMSYAVSGFCKIVGPPWRAGTAIEDVLSTQAYGHPGLWQTARRHRRLFRHITRAVGLVEATYPLIYLTRGRSTPAIVAATMCFHTVTAYVMGLNRFLTGFASFQPAVIYTAQQRGRLQRDDTVLYHVLSIAGAAAALAAVDSLLRQRRLRRGRETMGERSLRAHGYELRYTAHSRPSYDAGTRDVVVLIQGPGMPVQAWQWFIDDLADDGATVVVCERRPERRPEDATDPADNVAHALAVVLHELGLASRPVHVVAHGRGADIALKMSRHVDARLDQILLLDPISSTHDFLTGPESFDTHEREEFGMRELQFLLTLGFGVVAVRQWWVRHLPQAAQGSVRDQMSNPSTWKFARRELAQLRRVKAENDEDVPVLPGAICVVLSETASRRADGSTTAKQRATEQSTFVSIPRTDGFTLLTDRRAVTAALAIARSSRNGHR